MLSDSVRKRLKPLLVLVCIILLVAVGWFSFIRVGDNFHAITPGVAYRSGQLEPERLAQYVAEYNIRSVISLRGMHPGRPWYDKEVAACRELGIEFQDAGLSLRELPTEVQLERLTNLFKWVKKPVLIHCKSGADRTGLATAMWMVAMEGKPPSEARKAFSLRYGHVWFGRGGSLQHSFDEWALQWESRKVSNTKTPGHKAGVGLTAESAE